MYCMCIYFEEKFHLHIYLQDLTQQHIPSRLLEYSLQCIVECSIPPQREYEYEKSLVLFSLITNADHLLVHFDL